MISREWQCQHVGTEQKKYQKNLCHIIIIIIIIIQRSIHPHIFSELILNTTFSTFSAKRMFSRQTRHVLLPDTAASSIMCSMLEPAHQSSSSSFNEICSCILGALPYPWNTWLITDASTSRSSAAMTALRQDRWHCYGAGGKKLCAIWCCRRCVPPRSSCSATRTRARLCASA